MLGRAFHDCGQQTFFAAKGPVDQHSGWTPAAVLILAILVAE
jgi:hypothetical protein